MRKILFKGKNIRNGVWMVGQYAVYRKENVGMISLIFDELGRYVRVIPETVGQYTEIVDNNGKEIFEGDIVKVLKTPYCNGFVKENDYGVVEYDDEFANYKISFNHIRYGYEECLGNYRNRECEVVGNIYDNPELLDGENNGNNSNV